MSELTAPMLNCLQLMAEDPEGALQLTRDGYWTVPSAALSATIADQRVSPRSKVLFSTVTALEHRGFIARRFGHPDFPQPRVLTEAGREALRASQREEAS